LLTQTSLKVVTTIKYLNFQMFDYSNIETFETIKPACFIISNMAQQLSPKQYIQTRARTLPVYKCFVNKDWESAHMAQVIVMRRHVNGNITTGIYLVDLLCLGVKDATYFFNEPEAEIEERFGDDFNEMFMQVDYTLAHNIVYAGHDFALEYDIKPHPDFAIAKFILEEDDDTVELIDIEVGQEGKPHLVVRHAGQNRDALAKLRKNAGEGNYLYTIAADLDNNYDEEEDEEDYEEEDDDDLELETGDGDDDDDDKTEITGDDDEDLAMMLDEIELGELTVDDARFISDEDIFNEHEVSEREDDEKLTINVEAGIRALQIARPELFENDEEIDEVTAGFVTNENYTTDLTEEQETQFSVTRDGLVEYYENLSDEERPAARDEKPMEFAILESHRENPLIVAMVFENSLFDANSVLNSKAKTYLQVLVPEYLTASLSLALAAQIKQEDMELYHSIYNSSDIADAFPGKTDFGSNDVNTYCLIQTLVSLKDNDLASAVYYYYLSAETEVYSNLLLPVQAELLSALGKELGFDKGEDEGKPTLRIV